MAERTFTRIGRVAKPHGIKGEVSVDYFADSPFLLDECASLRLVRGRTVLDAPIASWRMHKGRPLVIFKGITDRNRAEELRGMFLEVPRDELPPPDEDEILLDDIVGLAVFVAQSAGGANAGSRIGEIESVYANDHQEVWTIRTDDGREVLFPAAEELVESTDLDEGRVDVIPPEGLLDLYLAEPDDAKKAKKQTTRRKPARKK